MREVFRLNVGSKDQGIVVDDHQSKEEEDEEGRKEQVPSTTTPVDLHVTDESAPHSLSCNQPEVSVAKVSPISTEDTCHLTHSEDSNVGTSQEKSYESLNLPSGSEAPLQNLTAIQEPMATASPSFTNDTNIVNNSKVCLDKQDVEIVPLGLPQWTLLDI